MVNEIGLQMAISKKNRRIIKYKGNIFLWWVDDEFDGLGNMLSVNVASEDKKFLVKHFAIQKNPDESYLSVIGQYFPRLDRKTGDSVKLSCPNFANSFVNNAVTSQTIKDILDWCFETDKEGRSL
jgi:hypothetical protein